MRRPSPGSGSSAKIKDLRPYFLPALLSLLLLFLGGIIGEVRVGQKDGANRKQLKQRVVEIASTMDPSAIKQLHFDESDRQSPAYQRLCRQLQDYAAFSGYRSIFTMFLKGETIVFGPESLAVDDPMASPPGTVYQEPSEFDWAALREGKVGVEGVYTDEYGTFVGANAPVLDPVTGKVLIVVGIDRLADDWKREVSEQRTLPWMGAALLVALTWVAFAFFRGSKTNKGSSSPVLESLPMVVAAIAGLIVSAWLGLFAWEMENIQRHERFQAMALNHHQLLNQKLAQLQNQFLGLRRSLESGPNLGPPPLAAWEETLRESGALVGLQWIPSQSQAGVALPPETLKMMEEAKQSENLIVTSRTAADGGSDKKPGQIVLCQAVRREGRLDGYLLVTLDMQRFLDHALFSFGSDVGHIELQLVDVSGAQPAVLMGRHSPLKTGVTASPDLMEGNEIGGHDMPLFPFGKSFVLKTQPSASFYHANPLHAGWLTFASCFLGTLAICFLIGFNRRKEVVLQGRIHQFTHAVEQSPVLILITDPKGKIEYVNPKFETVTGFSFAEVQGRLPSILKSGMQPDSFYRDLWSTITSGREWHGRFHNRRKDGELYWEQAVISPVRDGYGNLTHFISVKEDITERKKVEEALQESEAKFRALFELSPFGIALNELDTGRFLDVNREMEKLTGYTAPELRDTDYWELTPKEYDAEEKKQLLSLRDQGRYGPYEKEFIRKDRTRCPVLLSGVIITNSAGRPLIWSIVQDITEQKKSKAELKYQSNFQRLLMDLGAGLINVPVDAVGNAIDQALAVIGKFIGVDRAYMFRYDFEGQRAQNIHEWCAPGIRSEMAGEQHVAFNVLGAWVNAHRRGEPVYISRTLDLPSTDPLRSWLERQGIQSLITVPMMDKSGCLGFVGFVAVREVKTWSDNEIRLLRVLAELLTNAEMRRRHDNDLILARNDAHAATRAKSDFLANMSHEIRTPMNGVIGMTGLLMETALTPEQRSFAEIVRSSGESLLQVINDILDFSKIESGKMKLEKTDFNLRSLIEDTMELLAHLAQKKKLDMAFLIDPAVSVGLKGDPGRLRQVLINLLGNAIKFTDNGEVILEVTLVRGGEEEGEHRLRFEVRDTGVGIPLERRGSLFQPFSQVDSSAARRHGGTGLGLAICRQLVELFDGSIGVEANGEKGSCFWFTAVFEQGRSAASESDQRDPFLEKFCILVVDRNPIERRNLCELLKTFGCRYEECGSGEDALVLVGKMQETSRPVDLVLLDSQLPTFSATEWSTRLKEKLPAATPFILLASQEEMARFEATGNIFFQDCLARPVRQSHLHDCLVSLLGGHARSKHAGVTEAEPVRAKILLAEDNAVNQKVAAAILQKLGCEFDIVANGVEALRALAARDYDLILMDCQMPELDGYETTRIIRKGGEGVRNPNILIIALTANALAGDREKCLASGMDDYLSKPLKPAVLGTMLRERLAPQV